MPIYEYECPKHGIQEHLLALRENGPYKERPCNVVLRTLQVPAQPNWLIVKEKCKQPSKLMVSAPSIINIERDWNEKANEAQRDIYTMAKTQVTNAARTEAEHTGGSMKKITEEGIQVAARGIAEQKRRGPKSDKQIAAKQFKMQKEAAKKKKDANA